MMKTPLTSLRLLTRPLISSRMIPDVFVFGKFFDFLRVHDSLMFKKRSWASATL
jgi:hypothetical protein